MVKSKMAVCSESMVMGLLSLEICTQLPSVANDAFLSMFTLNGPLVLQVIRVLRLKVVSDFTG